jgi:hypothetical protein
MLQTTFTISKSIDTIAHSFSNLKFSIKLTWHFEKVCLTLKIFNGFD